MARASGIVADLFCAADRRCSGYSVVVDLGGLAPPVQANGSFAPMKGLQSSLADKLNIRAVAALDKARDMPPGDARAAAMKKAMMLRNAVEVSRAFLRQEQRGGQMKRIRRSLPPQPTVYASSLARVFRKKSALAWDHMGTEMLVLDRPPVPVDGRFPWTPDGTRSPMRSCRRSHR
jgi:hypothetical protein